MTCFDEVLIMKIPFLSPPVGAGLLFLYPSSTSRLLKLVPSPESDLWHSSLGGGIQWIQFGWWSSALLDMNLFPGDAGLDSSCATFQRDGTILHCVASQRDLLVQNYPFQDETPSFKEGDPHLAKGIGNSPLSFAHWSSGGETYTKLKILQKRFWRDLHLPLLLGP